MDEINTALGVCLNQTVIGSQDTNTTLISRPNDREWCTVIECILPEGRNTTPLLIFKAKHVQQQWFISNDTPDWVYISSKAAFTTNKIGLMWLEEIFKLETSKYLVNDE